MLTECLSFEINTSKTWISLLKKSYYGYKLFLIFQMITKQEKHY